MRRFLFRFSHRHQAKLTNGWGTASESKIWMRTYRTTWTTVLKSRSKSVSPCSCLVGGAQSGNGVTRTAMVLSGGLFFAQAKDLQRRHQPATIFDGDAVGYVAALCIRDHWDEMAKDDRQWCLDTAILELERENDSNDPMVRMSVHAGKADRPAAYVLPKILASEPDNPDVLAAVATALTHTSEQVVLWCAEGVGNYLASDHQGLLFRCAGALTMRARLLIEHELRERTAFLERQKRAAQARGHLNNRIGKLIAGAKRLFGDRDTEVPRTFSATVREAFLNLTIDPQVEIASLDLGTGPARSIVISVSSILASVSDSTLARDFHLSMSQAVVESKGVATSGPECGLAIPNESGNGETGLRVHPDAAPC